MKNFLFSVIDTFIGLRLMDALLKPIDAMRIEYFNINIENKTRWMIYNGSHCCFSIPAFWEAIGYKHNRVWLSFRIEYFYEVYP